MITKEDIIRKLSSRKFWMCVAGFVVGLIIYFGGSPERAEATRGLIMSGASVLAYILAEGWADGKGAGADQIIVVDSDEDE